MTTADRSRRARVRGPRPLLALLALAALAACGPAEPELRPAAPPADLGATGLYADLASRRLAEGVLAYEPQYPLWSDGATKQRWIRLPEGASIDASDDERWRFPVGTRLWKEFALAERVVETRYLELLPDGTWLRATYLWDRDGRNAPLAPEAGALGVAEVGDGVAYDVPGRSDCALCHEHGNGVLGFDLLQLSPDRDPLAPHAGAPAPGSVDLPALVSRGLLHGLDPAHLNSPPVVPARGPLERAALGYLRTNCAPCHSEQGALAVLDLDLEARAGASGATPSACLDSLVGRSGRFRVPGDPDGLRLRPGHPETSVLWRRVASRDPSLRMPPLATRRVDTEAVELLAAWIRDELPNTSFPVSPRKP